jgi:cytochrome c biogenesis protein CcdA
MRRLRFGHRLTVTNGRGAHVLMLRFGIGWWPCLRAPFIQITFGIHQLETWYGPPSYLKQ